jgi:DNA-binding CsgD family transcriptional regulator
MLKDAAALWALSKSTLEIAQMLRVSEHFIWNNMEEIRDLAHDNR